jgi:hypothetical protein
MDSFGRPPPDINDHDMEQLYAGLGVIDDTSDDEDHHTPNPGVPQYVQLTHMDVADTSGRA